MFTLLLSLFTVGLATNTDWSTMKDFDSICSQSHISTEIRVDSDNADTDCDTLCRSVGSTCLDGWGDFQNERCPVGSEREQVHTMGCTNANHRSFVCSCRNPEEFECTLSLYDQECEPECNEGRLKQTVVSSTFDEPVFESTSRGEISGLRLSGSPGCSFTLSCEHECFSNTHFDGSFEVQPYSFTFTIGEDGRDIVKTPKFSAADMPVFKLDGTETSLQDMTGASISVYEFECTLSLYDQECEPECNEGRLKQTVVSNTFDEPVFESTSRGEISGLRLSGSPGCSFTLSCEHECFSNTHSNGGFEVQPYSFTFTIREDGRDIVKTPKFSEADMPVFKLDGTETSLQDMTGASISVGKFDVKEKRRNLYAISTPSLTKETRRKL